MKIASIVTGMVALASLVLAIWAGRGREGMEARLGRLETERVQVLELRQAEDEKHILHLFGNDQFLFNAISNVDNGVAFVLRQVTTMTPLQTNAVLPHPPTPSPEPSSPTDPRSLSPKF